MRRMIFMVAVALFHVTHPAQAQPEPAPCSDGKACFSAGVAAHGSADYVTALARFTSSCELGHLPGCTAVGEMLVAGTGVPKDEIRGVAFFVRACDGKYAPSCSGLAQRYQEGKVVTQDVGKAVTLYTRACELGYAGACNNLAIMYLKGQGVTADKAKALAYMERGCDLHEDTACKNLPTVGGTVRPPGPRGAAAPAKVDPIAIKNAAFDAYAKGDHAATLKLGQQACDLGAMVACTLVGRLYESGTGVPRDPVRATAIFQKGCDAGEPNACTRLGDLLTAAAKRKRPGAAAKRAYERGCRLAKFEPQVICDRAVGTSVATAQRLCDQQAPVACTKAASLYLARRKPGDDQRALAAAERACQLGNGFGCTLEGNLGHLAPLDVSAKVDKQDAAYERACALGAADGCLMGAHWYYERNEFAKSLAIMHRGCDTLREWDHCRLLANQYANGLGAAKDLAKARSYWKLACDHGNQSACENLAEH